jgi:hypothetical protein
VQIFSRVVQLCRVKGTEWSFLEGVRKSGTPIPRSLVAAAVAESTALIVHLCNIARHAVSLGSSDRNSNPLLHKGVSHVLAFFTATIAAIAERKALDDAQLRSLYPFLIDGIRGSLKQGLAHGPASTEWLRCSCVVLCQTARNTPLAEAFVDGVVSAMFERFCGLAESDEARSGTARELVLGFVLFVQSNHQVSHKTALAPLAACICV